MLFHAFSCIFESAKIEFVIPVMYIVVAMKRAVVWNRRFIALCTFINENKRNPSVSTCVDRFNLYRFYYNNMRDLYRKDTYKINAILFVKQVWDSTSKVFPRELVDANFDPLVVGQYYINNIATKSSSESSALHSTTSSEFSDENWSDNMESDVSDKKPYVPSGKCIPSWSIARSQRNAKRNPEETSFQEEGERAPKKQKLNSTCIRPTYKVNADDPVFAEFPGAHTVPSLPACKTTEPAHAYKSLFSWSAPATVSAPALNPTPVLTPALDPALALTPALEQTPVLTPALEQTPVLTPAPDPASASFPIPKPTSVPASRFPLLDSTSPKGTAIPLHTQSSTMQAHMRYCFMVSPLTPMHPIRPLENVVPLIARMCAIAEWAWCDDENLWNQTLIIAESSLRDHTLVIENGQPDVKCECAGLPIGWWVLLQDMLIHSDYVMPTNRVSSFKRVFGDLIH